MLRRVCAVLAMGGLVAATAPGPCHHVVVDGVPVPGVAVTGSETDLVGPPPSGLHLVDVGHLSFHEAGSHAHFPALQQGSNVKLTCCGAPCRFWVSVYHCPPCSQGHNGGLPATLAAAGWEAGHCAPHFLHAGEKYPMTTFYRQFDAGQGEEFVATDATGDVVVYRRDNACFDDRRFAGFVNNQETGGFSCSSETDAEVDAKLHNACARKYPGSRSLTGLDFEAVNGGYMAIDGLAAEPIWPMQVACPGCGPGCDSAQKVRKCAFAGKSQWSEFFEWPAHGASVLTGGCVFGDYCSQPGPWCPPRPHGPFGGTGCTKCLYA